MKVQPTRGKAILFYSLLEDGHMQVCVVSGVVGGGRVGAVRLFMFLISFLLLFFPLFFFRVLWILPLFMLLAPLGHKKNGWPTNGLGTRGC